MERNTLLVLCALVSGLGACAQSDNQITSHQPATVSLPPISTAMAVAEVTMPPKGYMDYCIRSPEECLYPSGQSGTRQILDAARWADLEEVNASVNTSVRYVTDARLYSTSEFWAYPNGRGDCEDFALLKRKLLLQRGWNTESLLITVALDRENLRHAVLVVATDKGDYVLDNQLQHVVAWADTGYTWQMRQTAANPNIWVSLTGDTEQLPFEAPLPIMVASASQPASPAPALERVNVAPPSELTLALDGLPTASAQASLILATVNTQAPVPLARPQRAPLSLADVVPQPDTDETAAAGIPASSAEST